MKKALVIGLAVVIVLCGLACGYICSVDGISEEELNDWYVKIEHGSGYIGVIYPEEGLGVEDQHYHYIAYDEDGDIESYGYGSMNYIMSLCERIGKR